MKTQNANHDSQAEGLLAPVGTPLAPGLRAICVFATWGLLLLAQPGLIGRDGQGWIAFFALVPWALAASRPGRLARTIEWAGATFGLCGFAFWMRYLLPGAVFPMGAVPAVYMVLAGVLLRHLHGRWPLALAVPMAWLAGESVRFSLDAPLSFGWWRLGTLAHGDFWYSEGARVFGVWGLSFGMAAWAGWIADRLRKGGPGKGWVSHGVGLGVPVGVILAGQLVAPPEMGKGPRVMVVTPGLEQELKSAAEDRVLTMTVDPLQLTLDGIGEARRAGEEMPDLVAFGETMLEGFSIEPGVWQALEKGQNAPKFTGRTWREEDLRFAQQILDQNVGMLLGLETPPAVWLQRYDHPWLRMAQRGEKILPEGTSLFSGVQGMVVREGEIWRKNGARIWNPEGKPGKLASKVHLVPAAENPYPAAHMPWMLEIIQRVGGYIPDFVTDGHASVLDFQGRAGRGYRVGALVCYDNSYDDPFTGAFGDGEGLDFYLVPSNEAWYEESVLMDHMLAFTRLAAIFTGRSVLRATNSGASALVGPSGRILDLLEQDGRHKMVRGTLRVDVPVPVESGARTPYIRTRAAQVGAYWLLLLGLVLGAHFGREKGNRDLSAH